MDYRGGLVEPRSIKWKKFEDSNLHELCSFQPKENDAGIFRGS
jgi:hypothetical protein